MPSVESLPTTRARRPVFVVIGMHRSGTSLMGSMLNLLGVNIAEEASPRRGNELGHYERWDIVALHEQILEVFDRNIASLKHDFPLPSGWWSDLRLRPFADELRRKLADLLALGPPPGFKDPRASMLLPIWKPIFQALDVEARCIVCLRHPAHVAESLFLRDGLDRDAGEHRWLRYTSEALKNSRDENRLLVRYEDWFDEERQAAQIERLIAFAGLPPAAAEGDVRRGLVDLVREDMNRASRGGRTRLKPPVRLLHQLATKVAIDGDPAAVSRLDRFNATYAALQQLLGGIEREFVRLFAENEALTAEKSALERKLADITQAMAALTDPTPGELLRRPPPSAMGPPAVGG